MNKEGGVFIVLHEGDGQSGLRKKMGKRGGDLAETCEGDE